MKRKKSLFKEYKPEVLSKYLYYNKIYVIESKYPTGSDIAQREYLYKELDSLTFYFSRNLDFYQYYRSKSTYLDRYYFYPKPKRFTNMYRQFPILIKTLYIQPDMILKWLKLLLTNC